MKLEITRASKRDNAKITVTTNRVKELFDTEGDGGLSPGSKFVLTFKGKRKEHDVTFRVSRDGKTGYADCPRGLRMPSTGRSVFYTVIDGIGVANG